MLSRSPLVALLRVGLTWSITLASYAASAAPAAPVPCREPLPALQERLLDRYARGPDVLRDFIESRRGIYGLDMWEVAAWAARIDPAAPVCAPGDGQLARARGAGERS